MSNDTVAGHGITTTGQRVNYEVRRNADGLNHILPDNLNDSRTPEMREMRINTANVPGNQNDYVRGGAQHVDIRTQEGNDRVDVNVGRTGFIHTGSGDDNVRLGMSRDARVSVQGGAGNDMLHTSNVFGGTVNFTGGAGRDTFVVDSTTRDARVTRLANGTLSIQHGDATYNLQGVERILINDGDSRMQFQVNVADLNSVELQNTPVSQLTRHLQR